VFVYLKPLAAAAFSDLNRITVPSGQAVSDDDDDDGGGAVPLAGDAVENCEETLGFYTCKKKGFVISATQVVNYKFRGAALARMSLYEYASTVRRGRGATLPVAQGQSKAERGQSRSPRPA
jgi:hypothetical protein